MKFCQRLQWCGSWLGHIAIASVMTGFIKRARVSWNTGSEGMSQWTHWHNILHQGSKRLSDETKEASPTACLAELVWCRGRIPGPRRAERLHGDSGIIGKGKGGTRQGSSSWIRDRRQFTWTKRDSCYWEQSTGSGRTSIALAYCQK